MELPLAHVEIDGTRLSEWQLSSGLSRSTMYELLKILMIRPEGRRVATSRKLVSYLSADQVQLLEQWSAAMKNGATLPQIRERIVSSEIVSIVNPILSEIIPGSSQTVQDGDLASKLEAAGLAVSSGLGLTTKEVAWILGVNPGGAFFSRGGITCTKTGKNCWLLAEKLDSFSVKKCATG